MTDIVAAAPEKPRGKKGLLIPLVATLVLGGAGFASSYLGFWSPSGMLSGPEEPVQSTEHMSVEFIDIPTIDRHHPQGRGDPPDAARVGRVHDLPLGRRSGGL
jgi:flagellar FliL protein